MQTKIKKSNAILTILVAAFMIVSVSFVFGLDNPLTLSLDTTTPTIIEIKEDHSNKPISHGAPGVGCADCHLDQLSEYKIMDGGPNHNRTWCTVLCHYSGGMGPELPLTFGNETTPGGNVTMPHHYEDDVRPGFNSCLSSRCHEDEAHPDDMRYAVLPEYSGHDLCVLCHAFSHGD